jgi:ArsR family transcriptional regulator
MAAPVLTDERIHLIARALADPRRLDLLRRIGSSGDRLSCESIRSCCEVTPATISHHMKELETSREGKFVTYRLRRDVLKAYQSSLGEI